METVKVCVSNIVEELGILDIQSLWLGYSYVASIRS